MSQEFINNKEQEQERQLDTWRRLGQMILLKHLLISFVVFIVCFCTTYYFIRRYRLQVPGRFEARATLVYYPKQSGKVKTLEDKQVIQLLARRQTVFRVVEELGLSPEEAPSLMGNLSIETDKKKSNFFVLLAKANTRDEAVARVNTFADICMREYVASRTKDLEKWEETVQIRRKELQDTLAKIEKEDSELGVFVGISSPESELERLNTSIMNHKLLLSDVNVQYLRAQGVKEAREMLIKDANPSVLLHINKIRDYLADIDRLDKEIMTLEELFTEKNPKLLSKKSQRDKVQKEFDEFKKANNITVCDPAMLSKLDRAYEEVRESISKLETLAENKAALEREVAEDEAAIKKMQEIIPKSKQLRQQRAAVADAQKDLEVLKGDINYQLASMKNDLALVEPAESAAEEPLMNHKMIFLAIFLSLVIATTLHLIVCGFELAFGCIQEGELGFYPELTNLGYLLSRHKRFQSSEQEKMVFDGIYYNFEQKCGDGGVIFCGVLPGAVFQKEIFENFEWNVAMGGNRMLTLFIVPAKDYVPPMNSSELCIVSYEGTVGALPLENPSTLTPSEMQMLQQDVNELRTTFDVVFIIRKEPLTKAGVFFSQILAFCDSAIIMVGVRQTKRTMLWYVINHQRKTEKPMMTIAENYRDMAAVINVEG